MADLFATLRTLLLQTPSSMVWDDLCYFFEAHQDSPELPTLLAYANEHMEAWPDNLRGLSENETLRWLRTPADDWEGEVQALLHPEVIPFWPLVREWSLGNSYRLESEDWQALLNNPALHHIHSLNLFGTKPESHFLDTLSDASALQNLQHLQVGEAYWEDREWQQLAEMQSLPSLRSLHLFGAEPEPSHLGLLLQSNSLPHLQKLTLEGSSLHDAKVAEVAEIPGLSRLRSLHLQNNALSPAGLLPLLTSPHLSSLEELRYEIDYDEMMEGASLDPSEALTIAQVAALPSLKKLMISGLNLEDEAFEELLRAPFVSQLTHLELSGSALDGTHMAALSLCHKPHLTYLSLEDSEVGEEAGAYLTPLLSQLTYLDLSGTELHDESFATWPEVADSPLETLILSENEIYGEGAVSLFSVPWSPNLKKLSMGACEVTPDGFAALIHSPWLANLEELEMDFNPIGGLEPLEGTTAFGKLKKWMMGDSEITDEDLRILAGHKPLRNLETLDCVISEITSSGVAALAESPNLTSLRTLCLNAGQLTDDAAIALARSTNLPSLTVLNLSENMIGDEGVKALAEGCQEMPGLRELHLNHNEFRDEGARAILQNLHSFPSLVLLTLNENDLSDDFLRLVIRQEFPPRFHTLHLFPTEWMSSHVLNELYKCVELRRLRESDFVEVFVENHGNHYEGDEENYDDDDDDDEY